MLKKINQEIENKSQVLRLKVIYKLNYIKMLKYIIYIIYY